MSLRSFHWQRFAGLLILSLVLAACATTEQPSAARQTSVPPRVQPDTSGVTDNSDPGDAARGEQLFTESVGGMPSCSTCHALDSSQIIGPGMAGIGERAGSRVEGQTAAEYLHTSIVDSGEFVVEGYQNVMPDVFEQSLSEAEIRALIAYLLSL
ncbi:sulfur-oxidizing protein SoxX [Anaerolineae bacterium]|nr:sulfur-oxidizing protein SoxX [Anaerolineae bacterium]